MTEPNRLAELLATYAKTVGSLPDLATAMVMVEAAASVELSHDDHAQTYALDGTDE